MSKISANPVPTPMQPMAANMHPNKKPEIGKTPRDFKEMTGLSVKEFNGLPAKMRDEIAKAMLANSSEARQVFRAGAMPEGPTGAGGAQTSAAPMPTTKPAPHAMA